MWKRLNTKDRPFDRTIVGSPTLVETTADQDLFRNSASINNGSFSISSRPAFGRKGTGDVLKELPAPPFHSLQISGFGEARPQSEVPTASSIYSQASPDMNDNTTFNKAHPPRSSSLYPNDVSPPESIHTQDKEIARSERDSPNVSPISDSPSLSYKQSPVSTGGKFNSNLPVPKKTRKFWNRPSVGSPEQGSSLTHWDVYSGEPTTSEKGKPPSTTPGAVRLHEDPIPGRLNGYGTSTHISAGNSFTGNPIGRKRVASRDLNNAPIIRPEWKGAGGRHSIVNPMFDKPLPPGKSATFPAGREKYMQEQREKERMAEEALQHQQEHLEKERLAEEEVRHQQEQIKEERDAEERTRRQQETREAERIAEENAERQYKKRQAEQMAEEKIRLQQSKAQIAGEGNAIQEEQKKDEILVNQQKPSLINFESLRPHHTMKPSRPSITTKNEKLDQHLTLSDEKNAYSSGDQTPSPSGQHKQFRNSSLTPDDTRSPLARNPSNEEMKDRRSHPLPNLPPSIVNEERASAIVEEQGQRLEAVSNVESNNRKNGNDSSQIESRFRDDLQHMHLQEEPRSRFSSTTCATTNYDSPPATPEIGSNSPAFSATPNSILNRKRPVAPAGIPNSRAAARKPTPSEASITSQGPTESKRKSLPKSPPEVNAVSRVASLQAKLDNLRCRRGNLQTVIHELTHVVQPSSIAYDMASRQEIKRTVEGLNKELSEVKKDEHETGLKLHRTMKRDDEFAAYEPTSIWVRRVTS